MTITICTALSLSARRAWIEIDAPSSAPYAELRSLSARRAWIEIKPGKSQSSGTGSLSARRAWIEIGSLDDILAGVNEVALRKESVDRNCQL